MKRFRILMVLSLVVMLGCTRDKVKEFIPGTYVNSAGGEFAVASDTLVIELVEGNNYVIHRKTGFNLVSDGKLGKREYDTEQWKAVYSSENQSLTELRKGKLISFFPDRGTLTVGIRVYEKVN